MLWNWGFTLKTFLDFDAKELPGLQARLDWNLHDWTYRPCQQQQLVVVVGGNSEKDMQR